METKHVILELRTRAGLSQDELAERIFVTRQAVSRWEQGETIPNIDTLKRLSELFDVSINTLLGGPKLPVCQCCGMPIDATTAGKSAEGLLNEAYCKWCYVDGEYSYKTMDEWIDPNSEELQAHLRTLLPKLDYWSRYTDLGGEGLFDAFKGQLIDEFNALRIEGMPKVESLNKLVGAYVNLEYTLPNGQKVKFLDDNVTYLGNQLPCEFDDTVCFGLVANMDFLLVCTYEENGEHPQLIVYKKR